MNNKNMIYIVIALGLGLLGGYVISALKSDDQSDLAASKSDGPCANGAQPLMWRNPMNPSITSPAFQKDSMGMDYIPICAEVAASGGKSPAGTVTIDPTVTQDIGVRVNMAEQKNLSRKITTIGRITYDETKLVTLHPKVDGWIDKLFVDKTGENVKKNTMLLSFYSPQLVASQEEYLLALANWEQLKSSPYTDIHDGAKRLLDSSLDRLHFLDIPEHQIKALKQTHKVKKNLHIHAPAAGVVTKIGVREGAHVTPMSELYQIADLSSIWVLADLYEYEINWVKEGDKADLAIASLPERTFTGHITYIYPYLDPKTRTNKVRIEFDNSDGLLKPDMFGDVSIVASSRKSGVFVPRESVLITGKKAHLFVQTEPGRFEPRTIKTGITSDDQIEIVEGVAAGEQVVSSGQFLIDSESSIREAAAKMVAPKEKASPAGMDMKGMSMESMETSPTEHKPGSHGSMPRSASHDRGDMDMGGTK